MASALDRLRDRKQANYRDMPICMDSGLVAQRESLKGEIARLQARARIKGNDELDSQLADLDDELEELNGKIRAESEWVRIKALAPNDYQSLLDEHTPTREQLKEARKQHGPKATLSWNTDTFPNAILAASAYVLTCTDYDSDGKPIFDKTEDQFTLDFVKEMQESGTWSGGEVAALVNAAVTINESVANVGAAGNG